MHFEKYIGKYKPNKLIDPYIIAEIGVNHEGNLDLAKKLIDLAKEGGANAAKFQTYKADKLASKNSPYYWDITKEKTKSQFELFKKYDKFGAKEYEILKNHCDQVDIEFMSTPFDKESANFINDLVSVHKISSSDITNLPFIELICKYNKPIILSTGASNLWEVHRTVELINKFGNELCLMHCVLNYPTSNENAHLGSIKYITNNFQNVIPGYSDHTLPQDMDNLIYSILLGAVVIEKHFTHDKKLPGNDHYHAMDVNDLKFFWDKWDNVKKIIGSYDISVNSNQDLSRKNARRSLVANKNIPSGKIIEIDDITWKRPAFGICPSNIDEVIGKKTIVNINEDEFITWEKIK